MLGFNFKCSHVVINGKNKLNEEKRFCFMFKAREMTTFKTIVLTNVWDGNGKKIVLSTLSELDTSSHTLSGETLSERKQ